MRRHPLIVLAGGGTGGSVTVLLAIHDLLGSQAFRWRWIGTTFGVEHQLIHVNDLPFYRIVSGKWRRYWSVRTLLAPLGVASGFVQSLALLYCWRPSLVVSAGSFVAVPVVWASWILRIPRIVIQQDRSIGLANRIMVPVATLALSTVRLPERGRWWRSFVYCGTLVRSSLSGASVPQALTRLGIPRESPVILLVAGATGSEFFNQLAAFADRHLTLGAHILHIQSLRSTSYQGSGRYHALPLVARELADYYRASTLVVSRAGMGVVAECAFFQKPLVVVPLPGTHQQENARWLMGERAAVMVEEGPHALETILRQMERLLKDERRRRSLAERLAHLFPPADPRQLKALVRSLLPQEQH